MLLVVLGWLQPGSAWALRPGQVLVADRQYGVIVVDPGTGSQEYFTGMHNGHGFADVVNDENGNIFALDSGGEIVRVNATTGAMTPVSTGGHLTYSNFFDLAPDGSLLAQGGAPDFGLVRVDPTTGSQTVIAAGLGVDAVAAVDAGTAYVMSYPPGSLTDWFAYRLDLATGDTTRISNFKFFNPRAIAIESGASFVVVEAYGSVSRVFPALGAVAPLATGSPFQYLTGVTTEANGTILVADPQGNPSCNPPGPPTTCSGALYRVDPVSGAVTLVSEQGKFLDIAGIDLYRGPDTTPAVRSSWGRVKTLYR